MRGIPISDVKDHARKEASFGSAKQKRNTRNEVGPPISANAAETTPHVIMMRAIQVRAPNRCRARLLGTSREEIAEKENAGAETIGLRINADRLVHLQRGEANIHTVDVVDQISSNQEWQQTPGNAAHRCKAGVCVGVVFSLESSLIYFPPPPKKGGSFGS